MVLFDFRWRHKFFLLFKLFLLEKRVIFFGSPVKPVCSLIIAITSLHPQLLTHGLNEAAISRKITLEKPSSFLNTGNISTNQIDATVPQDITTCLPNDDLTRRKDTFLPSKIKQEDLIEPKRRFD